MSADGYDINFFRYLTSAMPLSIFENYAVADFFRDVPPGELRRRVADAVRQEGGPSGRGFHLYVSMPFCAEDCAYCHCSHTKIGQAGQMRAYEERLMAQMKFFAEVLGKRRISSLYFGGGTPSLLAEPALKRILSALSKTFAWEPGFHFNFEAHPASLTRGKIAMLKAYGVSRISLGVQSLDDKVLKQAGRRQTSASALKCIEEVRKHPGILLNVDLIAGLPGQSVAGFTKGLRETVRQRPDSIHINPFSNVLSSRYAPNARGGFKDMVERRQEMVLQAKEILGKAGYVRLGFEAYQLREGTENIQQGRYLSEFENIIGIGDGAQSMLFQGLIFRCRVAADGKTAYHGCTVDRSYFMANYMILHLLKGLKTEDFREQFGALPGRIFPREIARLKQEGIVREKGGRLAFAGRWTMEGLFEYFAATKIFFGAEVLNGLRRIHTGKYRPDRRYSFRTDGFVPKMDDAFFLLTLYDVGY